MRRGLNAVHAAIWAERDDEGRAELDEFFSQIDPGVATGHADRLSEVLAAGGELG